MLTKRVLPFIYCVTLIVALTGCQTMGGINDLTPQETYYQALAWYNHNQEVYLDYYDACSPECQTELKDDVDPVFARASKALDLWAGVMGADTEQEQIKAWVSVKNQLIVELLDLGVIGD